MLLQQLLLLFLFSFSPQKEIPIPPQKVKVFDIQKDKSVEVYCENKSDQIQSVKIKCQLTGMSPSRKFPMIVVIKPHSTKLISVLKPKKSARQYNYKYSYEFVDGNVNSKHDDSYIYNLPYKKGRSYILGQGYNGHYSHHNSNSLDFNMDVGTPIHAMRGGKVVYVVEKNKKGCASSKCAKYANQIRIQHSDGTYADYYHLKYKGVIVNSGDQVKKGQHIGYSGNTGWTSGPHLHVKIYKATFGRENPGFRTKFRTRRGAIYLKEKRSYSY